MHTQGIVSVDKEKMEVTIRAGSTLSELNSLLKEHGLAMKILGGAISTGKCIATCQVHWMGP